MVWFGRSGVASPPGSSTIRVGASSSARGNQGTDDHFGACTRAHILQGFKVFTQGRRVRQVRGPGSLGWSPLRAHRFEGRCSQSTRVPERAAL